MTLERFRGWLDNWWVPMALAFVVAMLVAAFLLSVLADARERKTFMDECAQHQPTYECTALWRSGQPQVVPVYVPIPSGR